MYYLNLTGLDKSCPNRYYPRIITINVLPTDTIDQITGPTLTCRTNTNTYGVTVPSSSSIVWSVLSGGTIQGSNTGNNVNVLWNTAGTHTIQVIQTTAGSCTDTAQLNVTVTAPVAVNAGIDRSGCLDDTITLQATGGYPPNYVWSPNVNILNRTSATPQVIVKVASRDYIVTSQNNTGCVSRDTVRITRLPGPGANAGPDKTTCSGCDVTIGTASQTGVTYSWSPAGALNNATLAQPTANITIVGTTVIDSVFTVTVTDNITGCTSTDNVTISINPIDPIFAGDDTTVCSGATVFLGEAPRAGYTYSWTPTAGLNNPTISNPELVLTTPGTFKYLLEATFGSITLKDSVEITILSLPAPVVNAGANTAVCATSTIQVGGATQTGVTYQWSPATFLNDVAVSNPTITAPDVAEDSLLRYELLVIDNVSGCENKDSLEITVNNLPKIDLGNAVTVCAGDTAQFSPVFTADTNVTYLLTDASGLNTILDNTNPSSQIVTTTTPGTYPIVVTATDTASGCTFTDTKDIVVLPLPVANAGPDQTVCIGDTAFLGVNAVANVSYMWTTLTGTATVNNMNIANPYVVATTAGTSILELTATSATNCEKKDTVTVTVNPLPTAFAGPDTTICSGITYTTGQIAKPGETYTWRVISGTYTIANPTITPITFTPIPSTTAVLELCVANTNGCVQCDTATVTVAPLPVANAGPDQTICVEDTAFLGVAAVTGTTYSWIRLSGTASVNNAAISNPFVVGTTAGVTTFELIATSSVVCEKRDTVVVTVNPLPTAFAGSDQSICVEDTIQIGQTPVLSTVYSWIRLSGTATLSANNMANPTVIGLATATGATTFELTATNGSNCEEKDTVTITVNPLPVANAGSDQTICVEDTAFLGVAAVTGTTYSWIRLSGTATVNNAAISNPFVVGATAGVSTFELTATSSVVCEKRDTVVVTVNPLPTAFAGSDQSICVEDTIQIGQTPVLSTVYSWIRLSGTATLSANNMANPTVIGLATATGATTFELTATNGSNCEEKDTVTITVNPLPAANAGPDITLCVAQSGTIGTPSTITGVNYSWTKLSGSAVISSSTTSSTATVTAGSSAGTSVFVITVTNATTLCLRRDTVDVITNPLPVVNAGLDVSVCPGDTAFIGETFQTGFTYSWTGGTVGNASASRTFALGVNNTNSPITRSYTLTKTNTATNCQSTDVVVVTTNPGPLANAGPDLTICNGQTVSLGVAAMAGNGYLWTGGTVSNPAVSNPDYTGVTGVCSN